MFYHLIDKWQPKIMDFLLLIQPYNPCSWIFWHGNFELNKEGRLRRPDFQANYILYIYRLTDIKT